MIVCHEKTEKVKMTERSLKGQAEQFAQQAAGRPSGLLREPVDFLRHNRK